MEGFTGAGVNDVRLRSLGEDTLVQVEIDGDSSVDQFPAGQQIECPLTCQPLASRGSAIVSIACARLVKRA